MQIILTEQEQNAFDIMGIDTTAKVQDLVDRIGEQAKQKAVQDYVVENNLVDTALEAKVALLKGVRDEKAVGLDGREAVSPPLQGV